MENTGENIPTPPQPEGQVGGDIKSMLSEAEKRFGEAKNKLERKGDPEEIIEKFDTYVKLLKLRPEERSDEDKEKHDTLQEEITKAGKADPDVEEYISMGMLKTVMEEAEEEEKKEPKENKEESFSDEEKVEAEEINTKLKSLTSKVTSANGEEQKKAVAELGRVLGDIGDSDLMKKIHRARGTAEKVIYGVSFTFFIAVALYFLLAEWVGEAFEGKH